MISNLDLAPRQRNVTRQMIPRRSDIYFKAYWGIMACSPRISPKSALHKTRISPYVRDSKDFDLILDRLYSKNIFYNTILINNCEFFKIPFKTLKDENDPRLELAKLIGLDKAPAFDSKAIENMAGILRDETEEEVDAVDLVREIRN